MKARESGMPGETYWSTFFDADAAVERLMDDAARSGDIVEFGCGYGTFTIPCARRTTGIVTALDIDPGMVDVVRHKAGERGLTNVRAEVRDFMAHGTGLPSGSQAHAMIYNLLHLERPVALLREAHRVLSPGGTLSVMHWRRDIPTPRGPSLDIRPSPAQCRAWMEEAGFAGMETVGLEDCCPFHFGLKAAR